MCARGGGGWGGGHNHLLGKQFLEEALPVVQAACQWSISSAPPWGRRHYPTHLPGGRIVPPASFFSSSFIGRPPAVNGRLAWPQQYLPGGVAQLLAPPPGDPVELAYFLVFRDPRGDCHVSSEGVHTGTGG